jgi:FkbH-like protein
LTSEVIAGALLASRESPRASATFWRSASLATSDIRIKLAATFTIDPIAPHLGTALIANGIAVNDFEIADYDQISILAQQTSFGSVTDPDLIIALWRIEDLLKTDLDQFLAGDESSFGKIEESIDQYLLSISNVTRNTSAQFIFAVPMRPTVFSISGADHTQNARLDYLYSFAVQRTIEILGNKDRIHLFSMDRSLDEVAPVKRFDTRNFLMYRQPFSPDATWAIGKGLAALIASLRTLSPKVIVLDCDNTLWGGIVGEDGVSGIQLGDDFPGSAFRYLQREVKQLKERGIMLAIASKNDESSVHEVFDSHDAMILKRADIIVERINWLDKADNIVEIASELNIGLDAVLFIDDSDHEISTVKSKLPMVHCLKVPSDPEDIPGLLAGSSLFDNLAVSSEDRKRTSMMQAEQLRSSEKQAMSHEEFLASLELKVKFGIAKDSHLARITQLINKTNQFNLSTIRRDESKVSILANSDTHNLYWFRVSDRFGDYGLVSVVITERISSTTSRIDTFLMSCRVLARGIEQAIIAAVGEFESALGVQILTSNYIKSDKNVLVADLYDRFGFELLSSTDSGNKEYSLEISKLEKSPKHITIDQEI